MLSKIIKNVKCFKLSKLSQRSHHLGKKINQLYAKSFFKKRPTWFFSSIIALIFVVEIAYSLFLYINLNTHKNGLAEASRFLNSVNQSKKIAVWSNRAELCQRLKGQCFSGETIPEYQEFDYFVFFVNQPGDSALNDNPFSTLKDTASTAISLKQFGKPVVKARIIARADIPAQLLPPPPEFTFAIIGDSQRWNLMARETKQFHAILKHIQQFNPDFLLAMGDLTPDYACLTPADCRPYFEQWRDDVKQYVPVIYPAFGNHDEFNRAREFWSEVFALPKNGPKENNGTTFYFDYKNSRFVVVDSEKEFQQQEGSGQMNWLNNNLAENHQRNTFVISHAPNFPIPKAKQTYQWQLLFKNKVFAQFSGDTHIFCQRTLEANRLDFVTEGDKINHFIIGNAGSLIHPLPPDCENQYHGVHFAIVKVSGPEMTVTTYRTNGELISESKVINQHYFSSN